MLRKRPFRVTETDLKVGVKENPLFCPVARSIRRLLRTRNVSVGLDHVRIDGTTYHLPMHVTSKIRAFDLGENVESFTFELEGLPRSRQDPEHASQ